MVSSFKANPEGLLLLAAGAVLLMRKSSSPSTPRAEAQDYYSPATSSAAGFAQQAKDTASSFAAGAADYAGQARDVVGTQSERIAKSAQSAFQNSLQRVLDEQPLMLAAAGLAAGAAVAAVFPTTGLERRALGPVGDQISDAASRMGEQLKDATLKAGTTIKEAAEERGLNREGLKDVVKEAATAFKDSVTATEGGQDFKAGQPEHTYKAQG
jgi:hypothetical protein